MAEILASYGLEPNEYWPVVNALRKRPEAWVDFMMRFTLITALSFTVLSSIATVVHRIKLHRT